MNLGEARWIVIDCESSGLDPRRDRLLSIGAVAVREGAVRLDDTYAALVRQQKPSAADNVLVHGITGEAQLAGRPVEELRGEFERFAGDAIPAAFHAPFDAELLERAGFRLRGWLDLEPLARALFPETARQARALDDWLTAFGIRVATRHDALLDAAASAELLLVLLAEAKRQKARTVRDVLAAARGSRWLAPR